MKYYLVCFQCQECSLIYTHDYYSYPVLHYKSEGIQSKVNFIVLHSWELLLLYLNNNFKFVPVNI